MSTTTKKTFYLNAVLAVLSAFTAGAAHSASPKANANEVDASSRYNLVSGLGTVNGIAYRIFDDLSGGFAGNKANSLGDDNSWSIRCKKDAMSDRKSCSVSRRKLFIDVEPGKVAFLYVGVDHFPGKSTALRVDDKKPVVGTQGSDGDFSNGQVATILKQLAKGTSVTTRYYQWPYERAEDESFELTGFNEALDYAKWAVRQLK